jgi:hypothetical protein
VQNSIFSRMARNLANPIVEFFRCPEWFADTELRVPLSRELAATLASAWANDPFWRERRNSWLSSSGFTRLIQGLRYEHYEQAATDTTVGAIILREAYYLIRPLLGVTVRRHFQRLALGGWGKRPFPSWPVDRTVDRLHEILLAAALRNKCVQRVPFIWFWPDGHRSCALLTHDVETEAGLRFCPTLMDMDEAAGIKSAFQLVPEKRYEVSGDELGRIRARGFEINVHDLNHDGHLFRDHEGFRRRVAKINEYGEKFGASGFRAGALYRNQDWYEWLKFSYDMSVPNVAHLDPQHGGCCTIFPYFVGEILELPVTAIQDYSLFHVIGTYSIDLWRTQMEEIVKHHGLVHVIAHPDYLIEDRARQVYRGLLQYLDELRSKQAVWIAQPADVNKWWRQRSKMKLVWGRDGWSIEGEGSRNAVIAYAELEGGRLGYVVGDSESSAETRHAAAVNSEFKEADPLQ